MTREDINLLLISLGWTRFRDEAKDSVLIRRLENKIIWFLTRNSTLGLELDSCASNELFDKFNHIIGDNDVDYYTGKVIRRRFADMSVICQVQVRLRKQDYVAADIIAMSNQILEWASSVDIDTGLATLRALPTDCLGAMPVRHLAALAVAGDVETLSRYRDNFAAGNRMDFVPYIDEHCIARALELAERRKTDPNWIPDKPKVRV